MSGSDRARPPRRDGRATGALSRFFGVAVAGLAIDAAATFAMRYHVGLPLEAAGAIGYLVGALFVFVAHEVFTFPDADKSLRGMPRRFLFYCASQGIGFLVRIGALVGLGFVLYRAPFADALVFTLAVALSFCVNFLVSRYVVFKPVGKTERTTSD